MQQAFATVSGRMLDIFFAQWLDRKGAPAVNVEAARVEQTGGRFRINLTLAQTTPNYRLRVPVRVTTVSGIEEQTLELKTSRQEFAIEALARPRSLTIDPNLRLFRRLDPKEIPPVLRQVTLDPDTVTVIPSRGAAVQQAARALATRLMDNEPRFALDSAISAQSPALIVGLSEDVDALLKRLEFPPRPDKVAGRGTAQVWTVSRPSGKPALVITAQDAAALEALLRPLPHYGRQSWLVFDGAKAIDRGVWPSQSVSWRFD